MAGLMRDAQAMPAQAQPAEGMGEAPNVSPEEQAQYEQFVTNGMQLLYDDKGMANIVESIKGGGNPVEGLANTLVTLVMHLEDSAEQAGKPLSGDVLMHGGTELLEQMAEMAEAAGVHSFKDEELESALYMALDSYRSQRQQQGKLPEEELQSDMQQILQAEQQGTVDQILPGITEYAQRAKGAQQPPVQRGG